MENKSYHPDNVDFKKKSKERNIQVFSVEENAATTPNVIKNNVSFSGVNATNESVDKFKEGDNVAAKRSLFDRLKRKKQPEKNVEVVIVKQEDAEEQLSKEWSEYTKPEKIRFVVMTVLKSIMFILLLYLFLLSLSFMTIGFTMVSYIALKAGAVIKFLLSNPFAALAIGIFVTAVMQNATATTSIAVSMVGAGIISDVKSSIPIIMGSNIGTCVTNSFIALTLAGDPNEFKRAFSAATLNDGFNLLTTAILLPIEIIFGVLDKLSALLTNAFLPDGMSVSANVNFIGVIINPVTDLFIKLNSTAVDLISQGKPNITQTALRCCDELDILTVVKNTTLVELIHKWPGFSQNTQGIQALDNLTLAGVSFNNYLLINGTLNLKETVCVKCTYWCMPMLKAFDDAGTGLFWIILSIVVLIASLFSIVKVASLLITGPIAKGVNRALNAKFPGKLAPLTEIVLFLVSFVLTLIVQSSNIVTATLVPLCGIGMITVDRVFVMTLGSNIGTTVTGILSAFTTPPSTLKKSLQLGFVYTLFNTLGTIFWLPIPVLRIPKIYARNLGEAVFKYRWFLYVYVAGVYFIGPLILLGIALIPHWIGLAIIGIPIILVALVLLIVALLRKCMPNKLPAKLQKFDWLPLWMRSLEPYDSKMKAIKCCRPKKKIVIERRMSNAGQMEEVYTEKEQTPEFIPNVIRRLSAIDSIVNEARIYSRRNTLASSNNSDKDNESHRNVRRRSIISNEVEANTEEKSILPSMIRRLSAIESLVHDARILTKRNSVVSSREKLNNINEAYNPDLDHKNTPRKESDKENTPISNKKTGREGAFKNEIIPKNDSAIIDETIEEMPEEEISRF